MIINIVLLKWCLNFFFFYLSLPILYQQKLLFCFFFSLFWFFMPSTKNKFDKNQSSLLLRNIFFGFSRLQQKIKFDKNQSSLLLRSILSPILVSLKFKKNWLFNLVSELDLTRDLKFNCNLHLYYLLIRYESKSYHHVYLLNMNSNSFCLSCPVY